MRRLARIALRAGAVALLLGLILCATTAAAIVTMFVTGSPLVSFLIAFVVLAGCTIAVVEEYW